MILSIDQGTTGTTVFLFDKDGNVTGRAYNEFKQIYPKEGWVEHDPMEILENTKKTIKKALHENNLEFRQIVSIGITNQRETTIVWDKNSGKPVHNAIVWQCRRTAERCEQIKAENKEAMIREKTGLVVDAYFSATKLEWILNSDENIRNRAENGELLFGTIDTWLIWNLTGRKSHFTDFTNASRTMLFNISTLEWDKTLINFFDIPQSMLPDVKNSMDNYGKTDKESFFGYEIPITGVVGDQQAALFGQRCIKEGMIKSTYGTGNFMLMYTGKNYIKSQNGLLTTIAINEDGKPAYALEGAVFSAGSAVQWLRDELKIIHTAKETEKIAKSIENTKGVYFVPAFTGLGAPYWDMNARGAILGITRGSGKAEVVRATLEAIAFQCMELAELMSNETKLEIPAIKVDGGASANNFLMQFQSDITNTKVERPYLIETTALGSALLAGIGSGFWKKGSLPEKLADVDSEFVPKISDRERNERVSGWKKAVKKVLN
jgi:glycerol kinase